MITLTNGQLTARINPKGAELASLKDQEGQERIWQGAPGQWRGHAPVLFPIAGALKEDIYLLDGRPYRLAKHGFARDSLFTVENATETSATFLLAGSASAYPGFPFAFAFRVRFTLAENALQVAYITENQGDVPLYFGVGAHEAYACPEGIEAYAIAFEKDEPLTHTLLEGSLLTRTPCPVKTEGGVLPLSDALFANDSLVFTSHASRRATLVCGGSHRRIQVDFQGFDTLLLWKRPGEDYICIEPWSNPPDYVDTDQDIQKKPGITRLNPGEEKTFLHVITLL